MKKTMTAALAVLTIMGTQAQASVGEAADDAMLGATVGYVLGSSAAAITIPTLIAAPLIIPVGAVIGAVSGLVVYVVSESTVKKE